MKNKILSLLAVIVIAVTILVSSECGHTESANPMETMCRRLLPDYADRFEFYIFDDTTGVDRYVVESAGDKICIYGNNYNSMAVGLNRYLRDCCHTYVSWYAADAVTMPDTLPALTEAISGEARCDTRFFLNYCTFGYTMPYWQWSDWERLIDWMALNGVNMPLAITGQEAVWMRVWNQLGLTDEQIRAYFTGPAHLPWHRMSNIDSWQGPLPESYIRHQEILQKKILERERELNMTPVLPAFSGHVPKALKDVYPSANVKALEPWAGFDHETCGTYFIEPTDSLFDVIQRKYIEEQTKTFGSDHIYGVDPFNEMELPSLDEDYLADVSRKIYDSMAQVDPKARWLQMTWMFYFSRHIWTPGRIKAFLSAIPDDRLILLDYYCDKLELWRQTDRYHGNPYVWCYLGNFGGNTMLDGDLARANSRIDSTFIDGGDNLAGLGATLEALDVNPVMYEFVFNKAWNHSGVEQTPSSWIDLWSMMRGGDDDTAVNDAWRRLGEQVYSFASPWGLSGAITRQPVFTDSKSAAMKNYMYDNKDLFDIWKILIDADVDAENAAHRFDVVNVGRQALGNMFGQVCARFLECYERGDMPGMEREAALLDSLMLDSDRLLMTEPMFGMGKWVTDARAMGADNMERDYYEENARCLVTIWGGGLRDYANRGWGGLTRSFYRERWNRFTADVMDAARRGKPFSQETFMNWMLEWEREWVKRHEDFPVTSGEDALTVARELYDRYGGIAL